jgi:hypothetical protein
MTPSNTRKSWARWFKRPAKPSTPRAAGRLAVEPLEDRLIPSITPATLFQGIGDTVQGFGNTLVNVVNGSGTALPVINRPLKDIAASVGQAVTDLTNQLNNFTPNQVQNLTDALNQLDRQVAEQVIKSALAPVGQNVQVTVLDPATDSITVVMDLVKPVAGRTFALGTGLPGLPIQLGGSVALNAEIRYDRLTFGLNQGAFFLNPDAATDELKLTLRAGLPAGAKVGGEFGFLRGTAEAIEDGVGLRGALVADVTRDGVEPPRFAGLTANADLRLTAQFATGGADAGLALPRIRTDFHLDWSLSGDPAAGPGGLGGAPRVSFDNVSVGLGSLLSNSIGPAIKTIQQLSAPLQPLLDLLDAPIPGLSDAGLGKVSLLRLAGAVSSAGALPPHLQVLTKLCLQVAELHALISNIQIPENQEVWVNLGSYDLGAANGDLRLGATAKTITDLVGNRGLDLSALRVLEGPARSLREWVSGLDLPAAARGPVNQMLDKLDVLRNGMDLRFPVLDDPRGSAVRLLLGQDATFVSFTADFVQRAPETKLLDVPLWGPINARMSGRLDLDLHFGVRYDSRGLREFLATGNPAALAHGIAFDSRNPNPLARSTDLVRVDAGVSAGPYIPFTPFVVLPNPLGFPPVVTVVPTATIQGGLNGLFSARLTDPTPADGIVRPFVNPRPSHLFEVDGRLAADLKLLVEAWLGPVKLATLFEKTLKEKTLFDSRDVDAANPFRPPQAPAFGGAPTRAEVFDVLADGFGRTSGAPNKVEARADGDRIEVRVNGALRRVYPILETKSLTLVGTPHDDDFVVRDLPVNVDVRGGTSGGFFTPLYQGGFDTLTIDGRLPWLAPTTTYTVSANAVRNGFYNGDVPNFRDVTHSSIDAVTLVTPSRTNVVEVVGLSQAPLTIQTTPRYAAGKFSPVRLSAYDPYPYSEYESRNYITVHSSALDRDGGRVIVDGRSGADYLTVRETATPLFTSYTLTADGIVRETRSQLTLPVGSAAVRYAGVDRLDLIDASGSNRSRSYTVAGLTPGLPVAITAGAGNDLFTLGPRLDALSGTDPTSLTVNGGGGTDSLVLDDSQSSDHGYLNEAGEYVPTWTASPRYSVSGGWLTRESWVTDHVRGASAVFQLAVGSAGIESVAIRGGGSAELFQVFDTGAAAVSVSGGAGDDELSTGGTVDGLRSPVSFDGGAGADRLRVADLFAPEGGWLGNWYEVHADRVMARAKMVRYAGVEDLTLTTGDAADSIVVQGTPEGTTVRVSAGGGDDSITVGHHWALGAAGTDGVRGPVTVDGQAGTDSATVSDAGHSDGRWYVVTGAAVEVGATNVTYTGAERLTVQGTIGPDAFDVQGTAAGVVTAVNGGMGDDRFLFGGSDGRFTLDGIRGPVAVHGGIGTSFDHVLVHDGESIDGHEYTLTADARSNFTGAPSRLRLDRTGSAPITVEGNASLLTLIAGRGSDAVNVQSTMPNAAVELRVEAGDRVVLGSDPTGVGGSLQDLHGPVGVVAPDGGVEVVADNSADPTPRWATLYHPSLWGHPQEWDYAIVSGLNPGELTFDLGPGGGVLIRSGSGDDRFSVAAPAGRTGIAIDAGGGTDTLDYTAAESYAPFADGVSVDLGAGTATALAGIAGFENVLGSVGGDTLIGDGGDNLMIGNGGPDVLVGGDGRDILVGGLGADRLDGGPGDDLLVADATGYETYYWDPHLDTPWQRVQQEWVRVDSDYRERIDRLRGTTPGGLNGEHTIDLGLVTDDGEADVLTGGDGWDWFVAPLVDVTDLEEGEVAG